MKDNPYIYGKNAIIESINSDNCKIEKIFLSFGINNQYIQLQAKKNKIACTTLDKKKFKELEQKATFSNTNTQGVIALNSLANTIDLNNYLSNVTIEANPILVIIDGITDPHNLGAIARTAECAGVNAIIITDKGTAPITPTAMKTSAGAINHLTIIKVKNLINTLEHLKKSGFWIVGTDINGPENYTNNIYDKPIAVIVGSEGSGMSPSLKKHCDHLIKINMFGKTSSLNASVSAGVVLFEIQRQKQIST